MHSPAMRSPTTTMKKDIHPKYYKKAKITCACGNVVETGSTQESIQVELCSNCHPFYTGKQKLVDTARRVDKFKKRAEKTTKIASTRTGKKAKRAKRNAKRATKPKVEKEKKVVAKTGKK